MLRLILYGVFIACCYLTVQQWKTSQYGISSYNSMSNFQQYPLGSAFIITGETATATAAAVVTREEGTSRTIADRVFSRQDKKDKKDQQRKQQGKVVKKKSILLTALTAPKIGKNGMLLNDPWRLKQQPENNHTSGGSGRGYAPNGGALPTSPTFSTHYHENMWHDIDNGTCLLDDYNNNNTVDSNSSNSNSSPVYEWQLRAPYVILLGAMKAGTQALTSYLWQHPRFA